MKRPIALCIALLVVTAAITTGQVRSGEPSWKDGIQRALDARVAAAPGTAIALGVIDHGVTSTYFAGSTGSARDLDEHTLFEIGSVTKTFTATALAAMSQSGDVKLDQNIATLLPAGTHAPTKDRIPITLLSLAEQRSGLPRLPDNMDDVSGTDPYADYTNADMYAFLNRYALTRDPGEKYEYSNYGVGLLGQLLAARAGTSYESLIRQRVLAPLQMTETTFASVPASDPAQLAVGHDLAGAPVPWWHEAAILPAGGIRSSLSDMLKYLRCNMGQGPLARTCLFSQQARISGTPGHDIGLIWEINMLTGVVSHGGDTAGFHAFVAIAKDRQTGVVVLGNGPVVTDIAAHVLLPSYPIAACPLTDASTATEYAGTYCNALGGFVFTVSPVKASSALSIALLPQPAFPYDRVDPNAYYNATDGATFVFVRESGTVPGLWLIQNGAAIPAVKLNKHESASLDSVPSPFPPAIALDATTLEQYAGTYGDSPARFTVTARGGQLYLQLEGQPAFSVYPSAKDRFYLKVVWAQVDFNRDAAGNVTSLTLHQDGQDLVARRAAPA